MIGSATNSLRDPTKIQSFSCTSCDRVRGKAFQASLRLQKWPRANAGGIRLAPTLSFQTLTSGRERLFEIEPDVKVMAQCRWQTDRQKHATVVIWHGMEGSTSSIYMIATADKAFRAGFNVVRVNYRNCGGTEHLTPTLYHGGLSDDLRVVVNQLIENDGLMRIFLLGFSLGGNMVLKLAGEYGEDAPSEVVAVCVVVAVGRSARQRRS